MRLLPQYVYWADLEYERKHVERLLAERYEWFVRLGLQSGWISERPKKDFNAASFMQEAGLKGLRLEEVLDGIDTIAEGAVLY